MSTDLKNDTRLAQRPRLHEACLKLEAMAIKLGSDAKLPTTAQLRSELGISVKTLNDAVRELERRNTLRSVNGVGIYVAKPASPVIQKTIGLLYYSFEPYHEQQSTFMQSLLDGIRHEAGKSGTGILLTDENSMHTWSDLAGFLIYCNHAARMENYSALLPPHAPRVLLLHNHHNMGIANVAADDFGGAKLATEHLIALGHRRIAYMLSSSPNYSAPDYYSPLRFAGYRAALAAADIAFEESWVTYINKTPPNYLAEGERRMSSWIEEGWRDFNCTALLAHNDAAAIGIIRALNSAGLRVPEDVSVVGFDGTPLSEYSTPTLTTVQVPLHNIGARALQLLQEQIQKGECQPQHVTLPVQLKTGRSSAKRH